MSVPILENLKIALVVHPLHTYGGAEFTLKTMTDIFPNAPIFTAWYDESFAQEYFPNKKIISSYMQKFTPEQRKSKINIINQPSIYSKFDLSDFEVIFVVSDGFEKSIKKLPGQKVVVQVLTPPRFLWYPDTRSIQNSESFAYRFYNSFAKFFLHPIWKAIDRKGIEQADLLLPIAIEVQRRINESYGERNSVVVYPPVEMLPFNENEIRDGGYLLYLGRLDSYKGVDLAIEASRKLNRKLKIGGRGPEMERLKTLADGDPNIEFLGFVEDSQKWELLKNCTALLFPVLNEDFGIIPVEANACGKPVIAYRAGGVMETVVEGVTGEFFDEYTSEGLAKAIEQFDAAIYSPKACREQAEKFKVERFKNEILEQIDGVIKG